MRAFAFLLFTAAALAADAPVFPYGAVYFRKSNPPEQDWARDHKTAAQIGMNTFRHWFMWSSIEVKVLSEQARVLLDEMPIAAFKLGVLGSAENVAAIAAIAARHRRIPVVLDPVLASGRGDTLASTQTIDALLEHLLPLTTVLTPNSHEARRLAGAPADADLGECANRLIARGAAYVLITGTHEKGADVVNTLHGPSGARHVRKWPRLDGDYHGSGCTLASRSPRNSRSGRPCAMRSTRRRIHLATLQAGFRPAAGQFLPDRFLGARSEARGN
jgi:hydroxymethylpyrimidine/phosphomethylpyrimidine kinase